MVSCDRWEEELQSNIILEKSLKKCSFTSTFPAKEIWEKKRSQLRGVVPYIFVSAKKEELRSKLS
jgi:hypothetical protein